MASGRSLEELEQQLRQQDHQLDEQAQGVLKAPVASRLPVPQQRTPPRRSTAGNASALQASPMSPSARARAEVESSFSQGTNSLPTRRAGSSAESGTPAPSSVQPVDESLPVETQLKLLRSRLRIATAELDSVAHARDEWKARCAVLDEAAASTAASAKQRQAQGATHKKRAESLKQSLDKVQLMNKSLEGELSALRAELASLRRSEKHSDAGAAALQARLQRAVEERSTLKEENAQLKASMVRSSVPCTS